MLYPKHRQPRNKLRLTKQIVSNEVLPRLNAHDLISCDLVNRGFHNVVNPIKWKSLYISLDTVYSMWVYKNKNDVGMYINNGYKLRHFCVMLFEGLLNEDLHHVKYLNIGLNWYYPRPCFLNDKSIPKDVNDIELCDVDSLVAWLCQVLPLKLINLEIAQIHTIAYENHGNGPRPCTQRILENLPSNTTTIHLHLMQKAPGTIARPLRFDATTIKAFALTLFHDFKSTFEIQSIPPTVSKFTLRTNEYKISSQCLHKLFEKINKLDNLKLCLDYYYHQELHSTWSWLPRVINTLQLEGDITYNPDIENVTIQCDSIIFTGNTCGAPLNFQNTTWAAFYGTVNSEPHLYSPFFFSTTIKMITLANLSQQTISHILHMTKPQCVTILDVDEFFLLNEPLDTLVVITNRPTVEIILNLLEQNPELQNLCLLSTFDTLISGAVKIQRKGFFEYKTNSDLFFDVQGSTSLNTTVSSLNENEIEIEMPEITANHTK